MLQQSLEGLLIEGLQTSNVDMVRHCLRTYATIDKTRDAEALVGQVLVKPYMDQVKMELTRVFYAFSVTCTLTSHFFPLISGDCRGVCKVHSKWSPADVLETVGVRPSSLSTAERCDRWYGIQVEVQFLLDLCMLILSHTVFCHCIIFLLKKSFLTVLMCLLSLSSVKRQTRCQVMTSWSTLCGQR